MRRLAALLIVGLVQAGSARCDPLFSADDLHGYIDLRAAAANGEASWLDGGLGKTEFSGAGDGFKGHVDLAQSMVAWTPHIDWNFGATIVGQYQPRQGRPPSLAEAYGSWRSSPSDATRLAARVGLFTPPVSLEHDAGPFWVDHDMITSSAINSWIGEEVKVIGAEATISHALGGQRVSLTGAIFGFNDTAGTLLTVRGWALGDVTIGAPDSYRLPPLSSALGLIQASVTNPVFEIDHRPGAYAKLTWKPLSALMVNAVYYDNAGAVRPAQTHQWSWQTRFADVGIRYDFDAHDRVICQAMTGVTQLESRRFDLRGPARLK